MFARPALYALCLAALVAVASSLPATAQTNPAAERAGALLSRQESERLEAINWFVKRGQKDAIPALIQAMRYSRDNRAELLDALETLAGEKPDRTWHAWMLWQERNDGIRPFAGFDAFKAALYSHIDPDFLLFLHRSRGAASSRTAFRR